MVPTRRPRASDSKMVSIRLNAAELALVAAIAEEGTFSDMVRRALLDHARRLDPVAFERVARAHGKFDEWNAVTTAGANL